MILTVASRKGGVGKTTIAYELAGALDAVLVDLDWDAGGATNLWGNPPRGAWILDSIERGVAPRIRRRRGQPDLVPSHGDLATARVERELVADFLQDWAAEWGRAVVVDTHPGANAWSDGAISASSLVVMPLKLAERELDATEAAVQELGEHPLLLVPSMVPRVPSARSIRRLRAISQDSERPIPVAQPIPYWPWLERRARRTALVLQDAPGARVAEAARRYRELATEVEVQCLQMA